MGLSIELSLAEVMKGSRPTGAGRGVTLLGCVGFGLPYWGGGSALFFSL